MNNNPWIANKIFEIADRHGIVYQPGVTDVIEDSQILAFNKEYLEWADLREKDLIEYLAKTPSLSEPI